MFGIVARSATLLLINQGSFAESVWHAPRICSQSMQGERFRWTKGSIEKKEYHMYPTGIQTSHCQQRFLSRSFAIDRWIKNRSAAFFRGALQSIKGSKSIGCFLSGSFAIDPWIKNRSVAFFRGALQSLNGSKSIGCFLSRSFAID
jgi:hypothetical protein